MPLIHSASNEARSENISREMHAHPGMKPEQAQAIAYSVQREARSHGDDASEHELAEIGRHELAEHGLEHHAMEHEHDSKAGPYGSILPIEGTMNRVETMRDDRGYMQVGPSLADMAEQHRQMWAENVKDPENANGVVTPEGEKGHGHQR